MGRFVLALIIGGCFSCFYAWRESKLASHADSTPQRISAAELIAKGPGDNANIELTDYLDLSYSFVVQEKGSRWIKCWVPVVELNGPFHNQLKELPENIAPDKFPTPHNIKIIAVTSKARNEDDLARIFSAPALQGLVVNDIQSLGSKERDILARSFPGTNFKDVYLIDLGRTPSSSGAITGFFALGGLLVVGGGALGLKGLKSQA